MGGGGGGANRGVRRTCGVEGQSGGLQGWVGAPVGGGEGMTWSMEEQQEGLSIRLAGADVGFAETA